MKNVSKILVLSILMLTLGWNAFSQVSYGGVPPSFKAHKDLPSATKVEVNLNVAKLKADNLLSKQESNNPPCIAKAIPVSYNMENSGQWTTLADGREMWQLRLKAQGALAILLSYSNFYIPECGQLFIYSADKSHVIGAFTSSTHPNADAFSTEMVAGDDIILEYVSTKTRSEISETQDFDSMPAIVIDNVGYVFDHVVIKRLPKKSLVDTKIGESSSCMININCTEGNDWQIEKKGVCQMTMYIAGSWYICSGTLINNTAQDLTPYILSAFHCYDGSEEGDLSKWQFTFGYESPSCEDSTPLETHTIIGCYLRVASPVSNGSDGLLLELAEDVPTEWDVYYNGWDRRNEEIPGGGVGIHHPAGDIKKISTFKTYHESTWLSTTKGATNGHWLFTYTSTENGYSVPEGGSSGSPMFNSNHLIVGTLTGGSSSCSFPTGSNYYGKFWYHWDQYGSDETSQMKTWLDPLNLGVETISGTSYNPTSPYIENAVQTLELEGSSEMNVAGPSKTIPIVGHNLEDLITAHVDGPFQLSNNGNTWNTETTLPLDGGNLYIRFLPVSIGSQTGQIVLSNNLAPTNYVNLKSSSCPQIEFDYSELPSAALNEPYEFTASVTNNTTEIISYTITDGALPLGIKLDEPTGTIEGSPLNSGVFNFTLTVTDENGCFASYTYNLYVLCGIITAYPFIESFEVGLPTCWEEYFASGNVRWKNQTGGGDGNEYPNNAFEGNFNMCFKSDDYDKNSTYLTTPQLDISTLSNPVLSFAHAQGLWNTDQDVLQVYYRTSAIGEWKSLVSYTTNIPDWQFEHINLPDASNEYFIGFNATANYGYGVTLDQVIVASPLLEASPATLSLNNFTEENNSMIAEVNFTGTDLLEDITVSCQTPFEVSADKINWSVSCQLNYSGGVVYIKTTSELTTKIEPLILANSTATSTAVNFNPVTTGISDADINAHKVSVANPIYNELYMKWNGDFKHIAVVDLSGREVYSAICAKGQRSLKVDTNHWATGIYCIRFSGESAPVTIKVVKR